MAGKGVPERLRLTGLAIAARSRAARTRVLQPLARLRWIGGGAPKQLLIAPQDIRTLDPTLAEDLLAGHFAFAGRIVHTRGQSPFATTPPSLAWTQALMSFDWMRHLRAADSIAHRGLARTLVDDWIKTAAVARGPAWEVAVVARRMMAWLSQSPVILQDPEWSFYRRFMRSIGRQTAYLERAFATLDGDMRLMAAIALATVGLCADGWPALLKRSTKYLAAELRRQILADGGHIGRNPQAICDLLLDLLPLRQVYVGRGLPAPEELLDAVDRMLPMLRLFRHADGALALFNGMGATAPDELATVLAYGDPRATAAHSAPVSGYQRLEARGTIVVVDAGAPPPPEFSREAHAGCLAFELSAAQQRIIVNSGAPMPSRTDLRDAARVTAAHSTLIVDGASSCRFVTAPRMRALLGGRILAGPRVVDCARNDDASGARLHLSHDGYASEFAVIHERTLHLASDGMRLIGTDRLRPNTPQARPRAALAYALRFHLHPSVRASVEAENAHVDIRLPDGTAWRFEASGHPVVVEDAIFFAGPGGLGRSRVIVVAATLGAPDTIYWSLTRHAAP